MNASPSSKVLQAAQTIYLSQQQKIHGQTDLWFARLMVFQWLAAMAITAWASPTSWAGNIGATHPHIWAAIILGGGIVSLPIGLALYRPGDALTRHVIAVGQMLTSGLLIHLTGGKIETHFHIFGSLAFLACYRDWTVLVTASVVVALDHFSRGLYWPQSVYGVLDPSVWRTLEHAGWIIFENTFLIISCLTGRKEMYQISLRQAELEETNSTIEIQVRERTAALQNSQNDLKNQQLVLMKQAAQLMQARTQAEEASRSKSEFLANMSHEIRTPMTAILGFADLVADEGDRTLDPRKRLEYVDTIRRNGEHLLAIINDILDLSKIEAGKMSVEKIKAVPEQILYEVLSLMQVKAQAKGLLLRAEFPTVMPAFIQTDPVRMRQILMNLVGNAIKFTEIGEIILRVRFDHTQAETLTFEVVDTGIGLSPEQIGRLFESFQQADSTTNRKFGGTGLGLTISKRLAEMLGGTIEVASSLGKGSTFNLQIATGPLDGIEFIAPNVSSQVVREVVRPVPLATPVLEGLKILLAEDGPDNQRLIAHVLRKAGAEVLVVENGRLAVEALTVDGTLDGELASPPPIDLLLTDMNMPEMDGYMATRLLRTKGSTLPIIALTAHAMSSDGEKCRAAGCNDYATKPIEKATLIEVCRAAVSRKMVLQ